LAAIEQRDAGMIRFRQPRPEDRSGLLVVAAIMLALIWLGIVPAVMPAKE
jgi:hypothetical protein